MAEREMLSETWKNSSGESFRILGWPSPEPTKTVFLIHHGLGEHAGRYDTFARELAESSLHIYSFDARGHGKSVGKRGDAKGLPQYATDLEAMIPVILEKSGAERVVLFGHSLGAAIVAQYLTTREVHASIAAVILSAPPVKVDKSSFGIKAKLLAARVLRRIAPSMLMANEVDTKMISSVAAEVQRYLADPLVHDRLSIQLGWSIVFEGEVLRTASSKITLPTLVYQGVDDGIVLMDGTRELFDNLGSTDKTMHQYAGARHEVHHETPEIVSELFGHIRDFIEPLS